MSKITLEFKLSNPITKDERDGLIESAAWLTRIAEEHGAPKKRKPKKKQDFLEPMQGPPPKAAVEAPPAAPMPPAVATPPEEMEFPALATYVTSALNSGTLENVELIGIVESFDLTCFSDLHLRQDLVKPVYDKLVELLASRKAKA